MSDTGRPTSYKKEYARIARKACELGAIDRDLAEIFDVCEATINNWKKTQPEFLESLTGKELANSRVEQSLYQRALGYSHPETRVLANSADPHDPVIVEVAKHYPPDTGACMAWLANRSPDRWKREPSDNSTTATQPININIVNPHANSAD